MKTAVTDMFGIDVPILAFTHCRDVVAAVTKAGGLGVLGAVAHSQEQLEIDLAWIEAEVGGRPYGIDLIVPAKYAGDGEGGFTMDDIRQLIPAEHKAFVDDILRRYDVPPLPDDEAGLGRGVANSGTAPPFSANQADPLLEIALAHRPALIVNALGPPPPHMIDRVKQEGRLLGALAGKAQHAQRHVNAGVDLIIAQGAEAGGHTGEVGTMVLIPEIVDAVGSVPVVGAGGIGRGRQMAASSSDTLRSRSLTGKPARQLRTAWTDEWDNPDNPKPLGMPMQPILVAEAQARISRAAYKPGSGAEQLSNYFVGQIVGSMNVSKPAAQVVFDMVDEFIEAVQSLGRLLET